MTPVLVNSDLLPLHWCKCVFPQFPQRCTICNKHTWGQILKHIQYLWNLCVKKCKFEDHNQKHLWKNPFFLSSHDVFITDLKRCRNEEIKTRWSCVIIETCFCSRFKEAEWVENRVLACGNIWIFLSNTLLVLFSHALHIINNIIFQRGINLCQTLCFITHCSINRTFIYFCLFIGTPVCRPHRHIAASRLGPLKLYIDQCNLLTFRPTMILWNHIE